MRPAYDGLNSFHLEISGLFGKFLIELQSINADLRKRLCYRWRLFCLDESIFYYCLRISWTLDASYVTSRPNPQFSRESCHKETGRYEYMLRYLWLFSIYTHHFHVEQIQNIWFDGYLNCCYIYRNSTEQHDFPCKQTLLVLFKANCDRINVECVHCIWILPSDYDWDMDK